MPLVTLEDARDWVLERCAAREPVVVAVRDALGLVLADDAYAAEAIPPFANTAMDGFAVRSADTAAIGSSFEIVSTLAAGAVASDVPLAAGQAIRIMTGAMMPPGADAVIPVEASTVVGTTVTFERVANVGDCVRPSGEDLAAGSLAFKKGTVLDAGHLGVLASIGLAEVRVWARPRVGVMSTGDELVEAPAPLGPGQIRDSNRVTLLSLVTRAGAIGVDLGSVIDDEALIEERLIAGLSTCDALVTSGGVSMGDYDFIKVVLSRLSAAEAEPMRWMQIAIKPAKPLAFGIVKGKPVFGLPGNPVSSMVSFELFARPAIRRMMGFDHVAGGPQRRALPAIAPDGLPRSRDGKTHLVRVAVTMNDAGRLEARQLKGQASNLLHSMALANGLAVVPDGDGVGPGGETFVLMTGELP
jgi:molybdopterin molybdotransferase